MCKVKSVADKMRKYLAAQLTNERLTSDPGHALENEFLHEKKFFSRVVGLRLKDASRHQNWQKNLISCCIYSLKWPADICKRWSKEMKYTLSWEIAEMDMRMSSFASPAVTVSSSTFFPSWCCCVVSTRCYFFFFLFLYFLTSQISSQKKISFRYCFSHLRALLSSFSIYGCMCFFLHLHWNGKKRTKLGKLVVLCGICRVDP